MNEENPIKKASGPPLGSHNHYKHGYYSLKAKLKGKDLDKRTAVFKALSEQERELIVALGGDPSPQERIIIADTVKHLLFAASLDRYLMQLKSLVRKGKVHSVVSERTKIGTHIRENLRTLGLKRMSKQVTLAEIKAEILAESDEDQNQEQPQDE